MGRHRFALVAALVAAGALLLASCGGSSGASSSGVASLSGSNSKKSSSSKASKSSEQQLLSWVQCMRKNGVNLPDPTVDSNGNLTLRPQGGGGPGFGGGFGRGGGQAGAGAASGTNTSTTVAGGTGTGTTGGTDNGGAENPRRQQFQTAEKACGQPPQGAFGGFNRQNSQEFQDAALKFAQCMRKNGVNMPDPNFSSSGSGGGGGGFFRNINRDDPATQKALQACRPIIQALRPGANTSTTVAS